MWDFQMEELIAAPVIGAAPFAPCPVSPAKQLSQQRERGDVQEARKKL